MRISELVGEERFEAALWAQLNTLQAITWEGDMGARSGWYTWDAAWCRPPRATHGIEPRNPDQAQRFEDMLDRLAELERGE